MCPTEKGTVRESPLERVLDCLHVVFFETGKDRARDNLIKLLRLVVHMLLYKYSRLCVSPTIMDAGLQALFWFLPKKRTRNSRLTARAIRQSSSEKMYRIRRKTRLTVLLLTALVSHFTVERSFWQIPRTSAWFDLTYSTYSDDQWYASFRVSKNTSQFLLPTPM